MKAATLALVHKPPSSGGSFKRTRSLSRTSGFNTLAVAPLRRRRSPRIPGLPRCSARRAAQSSGNQTRSSPRLRRRVSLAEARSSENAAPRNVGARNIPITQRFDAQCALSSSWFAPSRFMATKLNCFDPEGIPLRESVSRKSYHVPAFPHVGGGAIAQHWQSHADVRPRRRERFCAPALANNRRQAGVSGLRLHDLPRLSSRSLFRVGDARRAAAISR